MKTKYTEIPNFEVAELVLDCMPGSDVSDCIRDAIILALREDKIIRFKHNCRAFVINPKELIGGVYEGAIIPDEIKAEILKSRELVKSRNQH